MSWLSAGGKNVARTVGLPSLGDLSKAAEEAGRRTSREIDKPYRDQRKRTDALGESIRNRQKTLSDKESNYTTLGDSKGYDAAQAGPAPTINTSGGLRDEALALSRSLADQSNAPSSAMAQHRRATDRGLAQQMALAQGSRDPRAFRSAMDQQGQLQAQSSLDSSIIASQEQQRQNQALSSAIAAQTGIRGQDIGASSQQASLDQQTQLANQAALQQSARDAAAAGNQQAALQYSGRMQEAQAKSDAIRDLYQQQNAALGNYAGIVPHEGKSKQKQIGGLFQGISSGLGSIFGGGGGGGLFG